jgi:hypothetical protein
MDLITLTVNKNHLISGISLLGVGALTYLVNRYTNTTKHTSNQTYYKPSELIKGIPNLTLINNNTNNNTNNKSDNIIYIFWNGDINSTYLLIDLLLQDKIIQPLYIERYSIIKNLENDTLKNIIKTQKESKERKDQNTNNYLKNIVLLKKKQDYELKQLEILRLLILGKYSEFNNNLLPTTYITSIQKDLEMTSHFFNTIQEIKPIYYDGIDFIEQIIRYIKYSGYIKNGYVENEYINNIIPRIILGCNKDYKNNDVLLQLIHKNIVSIIDLPLKNKDNEEVKYICTTLVSNDIMKYFLSNKNNNK